MTQVRAPFTSPSLVLPGARWTRRLREAGRRRGRKVEEGLGERSKGRRGRRGEDKGGYGREGGQLRGGEGYTRKERVIVMSKKEEIKLRKWKQGKRRVWEGR